MRGIARQSIKKEMQKHCRPTNEAISLMQKIIDDFIKESCTRAVTKAKINKRELVQEYDLASSIGLK